jgi:regulator of sigma E protease
MPQLINKDNQGEDQYSVPSNRQIVTKQVLINYIEKGSPAEQGGLRTLDTIKTITPVAGGAPRQVTQLSELQQATKSLAGQKVKIAYLRNDKPAEATVQLRSAAEVSDSLKSGKPKGYIGVSLANYQVDRYTWAAPVVAVGTASQITELTLKGLGSAASGFGRMVAGLITGNTPARQAGQVQATEQVSGPLGIFFVLQAGAKQGVVMVLFIIAIISLTLAIMNVLPIPALDGGRLFVTLAYRAFRRPLTQAAEERIHGTGFLLLMLLFILITVVDVERFL